MTFTPEETVLAQERIAQHVNSRLNWLNPDPFNVFGLQCVFYMGNWRRRDLDNMLKLVLDALHKVVWNDDWQVFEMQGRKDYTDMAHPRSEIRLYRVVPA
jgi:Holliday junction resolvase RusA-like endonuclease